MSVIDDYLLVFTHLLKHIKTAHGWCAHIRTEDMDEKTISSERIARLEAQMTGLKEDLGEVKSSLISLVQANVDNSREVLKKLENMEERMERRILDGLKANGLQSEKQVDSVKSDMKDLENRIEALEKWRWYVLGAAGAVIFILKYGA